ncbi:MAG: DUF2877 domain-containing protein [Streptosporangiaceae bacterium]
MAAASSALRPLLAGPARPAEWLGVTRGALYLKTAGQPGALVVLSHDAVRLPCGLLLPTTSAELPLTSVAPSSLAQWSLDPSARFMVGDGAVSWTGPVGRMVVRAVREWAPARPARGEVAASALAAVRTVLSGAGLSGADPGIDSGLLAEVALAARDHDANAVVARLLGSGPGLTPSGDDVLAGFLAGAAAFGLDAAALREATAVQAPARTTALSAALLWHAARGECIDELAAVAAVLTGHRRRGSEQAGHAVSRLLSVGHTSGAALALGLLIAADSALRAPAGRAA